MIPRICLILLATAAVLNAAERPNVLVFYADDFRADAIAALGNSAVRTPHLDALAASGAVFSHAHGMGSLQPAVCIPARAMLLSGRTLFRVSEKIEGTDTWPEAFARAGYATFITGKWHNFEASLRRVFPQGKAAFLTGMGDPYDMPLFDLEGGNIVRERRSAGRHAMEIFAEAAGEFIAAQTPAKRWLCYVPFSASHDPHIAPPEVRARIADATLPLPANFLPQHPFDNGAVLMRDEQLDRWPRTPEMIRRRLGDYYAVVTHLDEQVGRILAALEKSGQRGNTLIVFSSDSGLAVGSHGLLGKQSLYEHSSRSPLIVAGPGVTPGARPEALVYLSDIFPMLGALARVPAPEGSEGRSFAAVLSGAQTRHRDDLLLAYADSQRALHTGQWKLIRYPRAGVTQLFDLAADPAETRNLADDPAQAGRLAEMLATLQARQKEFGDKLPITDGSARPAAWVPPSGEKLGEMLRKVRRK